MGMDKATPKSKRLSPADWADEALVAIARGGLSAVAVELLAAQLGVTKGSFYWHFADRAALIQAALDRWEQIHTEAIIEMMDAEPDATQRLRLLLRAVVGVAKVDQIEVALLASTDEPNVAATMARATERRIAYVAMLYEEMGLDAVAARHRAVMAVSMFLGHLQLARAAPASLPDDDAAWHEHVDAVTDTLLDLRGSAA